MSDLISRQALCEYALNSIDKTVSPNDIMRFPSAEPERNVQECAENARCNERTAMVTTVEKPIEGSDRTITVIACGDCGTAVSIFDNYCAGCGARLEWE